MLGLGTFVGQVSRNDTAGRPPSRVVKFRRIAIVVENHNLCRLRIHSIPVQALRTICDARFVCNTILSTCSRWLIVTSLSLTVEESPKGCTVQEQVCAAINVLCKAHPTRLIACGAPKKIWIPILGYRGPWARGILLGPLALPVCGFRLLHARIHILCVMQVIVVQSIVFECSTGEPSCFGSFDQKPSTSCNILSTSSLKRMIRRPAPHVFDVARRRACQMNHRKCCQAVRSICVAASDIDICVSCTSHGDMGIPKCNVPWLRSSHVDLDNDSSWGDVFYCETYVLNLGNPDVVRVANLNNRLRTVLISKSTSPT